MSYQKFYIVVIFLVGISPTNSVAGKAFGLVLLTNCGVISEQYEMRVNKVIEQWGEKNPELVHSLQEYLAENRPYDDLLNQYNAMSDEQKEAFKESCDKALTQASLELSDPETESHHQ